MNLKNCFVPTKGNKYKPHLLKKTAIVVYSLILVFVNSFGGFLGIEQAQASTITSDNIISLTNQERIAWGLNSLNQNAQLSAAALAKANDMFEKQYWDHFGPNGESPWQFIRGAGYNYVYAGENLAKGFRTAEGVHEAWMASPTHKANIVSGNYKDIGVAVVDGVLLGKQTTLVVQMFGNLTSEVYGAAQEPASTTPNSSPVETSKEKVVVKKESGEIKSIRITSPQEGVVITDASVNIQGDTTNVNGTYIVEIKEGENIVGTTESNKSNWEFDKQGDWEEGEHNVTAILKNEGISSPQVTFKIDSKAPVIDPKSIEVKKDGSTYKITFMIQGEWQSISIVLGSEIIQIEHPENEEQINIDLEEENVKGSVILVISDQYGNTSELDISEYFIEEETQYKRILPTISLSLGDKISIAIVSFVLILLIMEIAVYWKKGKIKDALNDIFTVGAWWLILSIAILNGFSGIIN